MFSTKDRRFLKIKQKGIMTNQEKQTLSALEDMLDLLYKKMQTKEARTSFAFQLLANSMRLKHVYGEKEADKYRLFHLLKGSSIDDDVCEHFDFDKNEDSIHLFIMQLARRYF